MVPHRTSGLSRRRLSPESPKTSGTLSRLPLQVYTEFLPRKVMWGSWAESNKCSLNPEVSLGPKETQQRGRRYCSEKISLGHWSGGPINHWYSSFICLTYLDLK